MLPVHNGKFYNWPHIIARSLASMWHDFKLQQNLYKVTTKFYRLSRQVVFHDAENKYNFVNGEIYVSLQSRHTWHNGVLNHQPHHCFLNRLLKHRSKKTSNLHVTGLCAGNSPVTGEFPTQMASNTENVFMWWRHHDFPSLIIQVPLYHCHCCLEEWYTTQIYIHISS